MRTEWESTAGRAAKQRAAFSIDAVLAAGDPGGSDPGDDGAFFGFRRRAESRARPERQRHAGWRLRRHGLRGGHPVPPWFSPGLGAAAMAAWRATQAVLLAAACMLGTGRAWQSVSPVWRLAAVVLGLGYGAAAPASTHLLVPQTPRPVFNLVMSLRQIGVPLGGVLGRADPATLGPELSAGGHALLIEIGPVLLLLVADGVTTAGAGTADREPGRQVFGRALLAAVWIADKSRVPAACRSLRLSMPGWRCAWSRS